LWDNGVVTKFDVPGATSTVANEINNNGQIVGDYNDASGAKHGFLLEDGAFTTLDAPDSAQTAAAGINERGQIVGIYIDAGAVLGPDGLYPPGTVHGFLWDKGRFTTLDARASGASGINNRGQIVGQYRDSGGRVRGFLLSQGTFTPVEHPGDPPNSIAWSINDRGDIVIPIAGTGFEPVLGKPVQS
jgi:probable HAF family extracellular repeat protein